MEEARENHRPYAHVRYAGAARMLLYRNGKVTTGKLNYPFYREVLFSIDPYCEPLDLSQNITVSMISSINS